MKNTSPRVKKIVLLSLIIIIILFVGFKTVSALSRPKAKVQGVSTISAPQKQQSLNKDFTFPIDNGTTTPTTIKFTVQDAEINNQIVVQGQNATAVAGRTFLIVTLKLTNDSNQSIDINTRNYVRLSVNGDESTWLAPDIHNDPVEVQAISTKFTRVGFAINTTDKNLVLQIGEIKGDKQKIDLNLK